MAFNPPRQKSVVFSNRRYADPSERKTRRYFPPEDMSILPNGKRSANPKAEDIPVLPNGKCITPPQQRLSENIKHFII
jgi:hypothetical protein